MKKILFLNRNCLLDPLLQELVKNTEVVALQNKVRTEATLESVRVVPVRYCAESINYFVNRVLGKQISIPIYIKDFQRIVFQEMPDIIVAFDIHHFSFGQAMAYKKKHPAVQIVLLSELKAFPNQSLSRLIFPVFWRKFTNNMALLDAVGVFTIQGQQFFSTHVPDLITSIVTVPIDTERFRPTLDKTWLPDGILRILINARYASYKRHDDLFQALVQLQKQGKRFHLTSIGRSESSHNKVRQRVAQLGLQERVTFLDSVPHSRMIGIYHQNDVLVLPSYNEAIGMVVPEAMACGLPTITSDTVGANVYVKEGDTGLIFETYSVMSLARCLNECHNKQRLEQMGTKARLLVEEQFTKEILQQKFEKFLLN